MKQLPTFAAFAGFYGAVFLAFGILIPFWPLWLAHRGLSADQIGLLLACAAWARICAVPVLGYVSDKCGQPRTVVTALSVLSVALILVFPQVQGLWSLILVQVLFTLAFHPLIPLAESRAMVAVQEGRLNYGRMRLWGSITFIAGSLGAGLLLTNRGLDLIIPLVAATLLATVLASTQLPRAEPQPMARVSLGQLASLVTRPRFLLFLTATGFLQASHAAYYGFSALHWRAAGYSDAAVGWLWSAGAVAEILLFLAGARILNLLGPTGLLSLGAIGGLLRWTLTALSAEPLVLVVAQSLHALTFGAAHLGAMHFLSRTVPAPLSATAQGLYAALSGGLFMGLAMFLSGWLYQFTPAAAFGAMAILSAIALALATELSRRGTSDQ